MTKTNDLLLLVEDDDTDALIVERAFSTQRPDINILRAVDGVDALEKLKNEEPDLILMDIRMPLMDGKETLAKIKADPNLCKIPVIMISTSENSDDIGFCYQHHANAYIVKPGEANLGAAIVDNVIKFWFDTAALSKNFVLH